MRSIPDDHLVRSEMSTLPYSEIYSWSSHLTAEEEPASELSKGFVWGRESQALYRLLTVNQNCLILVIGPQGSGKTSLRLMMNYRLTQEGYSPIFSFKWHSQFDKLDLGQSEEIPLIQKLGLAMIEELGVERFKNLLRRAGVREGKHRNQLVDYFKSVELDPEINLDELSENTSLEEVFVARLDKGRVKELRIQAFKERIQEGRCILLDLPDYHKGAPGELANDISKIQWLWNPEEGYSAGLGNVCLFVQEELSQSHYFFNKGVKIQLRPFSPQDLVRSYLRRWKGTKPFTEKTLESVAVLSRGNYRVFKSYLRSALEMMYNLKTKRVSPEIVNSAIDIQMMEASMSLELIRSFPRNKAQRLVVVKILRRLIEEGPLLQEEVVKDYFNGKEAIASRVLTKMEISRYIERRFKDGKKIILRRA